VRLRDGRRTLHDLGPQAARVKRRAGLRPEAAIAVLALGVCPLCGVKLHRGNQRSCVKLPKARGIRLRGSRR